jgi:hypothetical protein
LRASADYLLIEGKMIIKNHNDVTRDALAVMGQTVDPRLRTIMISLVKHLHSFVRDVPSALCSSRPRTSLWSWSISPLSAAVAQGTHDANDLNAFNVAAFITKPLWEFVQTLA